MTDPHAAESPPGADEPMTPMWLPALGATLLIALGIAWAMTRSVPPSSAEPSPPSSATSRELR
jgi:hypothetical protein